MGRKIFGEMLKELRLKRELTLRKFCLITGIDPGNLSRWERGVSAPPSDETIERMAATLGLEQGTDEYDDFFAAAALSKGRLPKKALENEQLMAKLPVFFRTLDGRKLTEEQLDAVIEIIKENYEPRI
jgi:transcriptional regulator with XRE-family HTH domain